MTRTSKLPAGREAPVQARGQVQASDAETVHQAAAQGVSGGGGALPHLDQIQKSFSARPTI